MQFVIICLFFKYITFLIFLIICFFWGIKATNMIVLFFYMIFMVYL